MRYNNADALYMQTNADFNVYTTLYQFWKTGIIRPNDCCLPNLSA